MIDIDGKTFDEIKLELNSLKLDDKLGLDIVLVGDVEQGYIDSLHKYISKFNNPLCNIEWVIGEATAIAKVKSTFVRNLSILLTKLGMSKFMAMNSEKKMKLNVEAIRSMASAA